MHKIKDYADCNVIPIEVTVGKDAEAAPVLMDFEERLDMAESNWSACCWNIPKFNLPIWAAIAVLVAHLRSFIPIWVLNKISR